MNDLFLFNNNPIRPPPLSAAFPFNDESDTVINVGPDVRASTGMSYHRRRLDQWFDANEIDPKIREELIGFRVEDLLAFTRSDWKELLGRRDGLKLFTRIHSQRALLTALSSPDRTETQTRSYHRARAWYGECVMDKCSRAAVCVCSRAECAAALCACHTYKSLLTSHVYCQHCIESTVERQIQNTLEQGVHSAASATGQLLQATQRMVESHIYSNSSRYDEEESCTVM